jgi:tetratricopeptide (TPR) repeat protein
LERHLAQLLPAQRSTALRHASWLVKLLPELAERDVVPAPVWTLPPEQERRLVFAAVRRFLANSAGPAGTLLVLDDLHWASPDALDLLASLLYAPDEPPLRVVGAYRSTEVQPPDPLRILVADLATQELLAHHLIGPLAPVEAIELLGVLQPEEPALTRWEQMVERAGGVPFFLVSCALEAQTSRVERRQKQEVPWTVTESIRQRVSFLSQAARDLLAAAAIIGRRFEREMLLAVVRSEYRERELLEALEALCQARLLEESESVYQFAHDLIREVELAGLSTARRAHLHLQVAEAMEQAPGEPPIERLAYHYSRAGVTEKAVLYLEWEGNRAWALHANTEAERTYRELLKHLERLRPPLKTARACEKLGNVLVTLARFEEANLVLEQAVEGYRAVDDLEGLHRTLAQLARAYRGSGKPEEGIARLLPLLEERKEEVASAGLVLLQAALAGLYQETHQYQKQLVVAERAVAMAKALQDDTLLVQAQHGYGLALGLLHRDEEALSVLEVQVSLAEAVGDLFNLSADLNNLAELWMRRGAFTQGCHYGERAVEVAERLGDLEMLAFILTTQGTRNFEVGDWDQARRALERAVELSRQVSVSALTYSLAALGQLDLAEGKWETASCFLNEARASGERHNNLEAVHYVQYVLAERELVEGHPESARARLAPLADHVGEKHWPAHFLAWAEVELGNEAEAERLMAKSFRQAAIFEDWQWWLNLHLIEGLLRLRQKRWSEAAAALEQALASCSVTVNSYARAKTLYFYGLLHIQKGELEQARERLEGSRAILNRLGERLYAEQIKRALTALSLPQE